MAKEALFQKKKRYKRLAEALDEKWLDNDFPEKQTPDFEEFKAWDENREKIREADRKRDAKRRAEAWTLPSTAGLNLRGVGVYFVSQAAKVECDGGCRLLGLVEKADMWDAEVFVAQAAGDLSFAIRWRMALVGAVLMLSGFVKSQGKRVNGMLEYKQAVKTARTIWCSANFALEQQNLHRAIHRAARHQGSNWRVLEGTVDDYFALRQRRQCWQAVAVVTAMEKRTEACLEFVSLLPSALFLPAA